MSETESIQISIFDILGIMFIVGAPDFFDDKDGSDEASNFMFRAYRERNPIWPDNGKLLLEINMETATFKNDVPAGAQGLADLVQWTYDSGFAKKLQPHSMYIQGIILSRQSWEECGRPKIQACFITFVRNTAGMKERIIFLNGPLKVIK